MNVTRDNGTVTLSMTELEADQLRGAAVIAADLDGLYSSSRSTLEDLAFLLSSREPPTWVCDGSPDGRPSHSPIRVSAGRACPDCGFR